MATPGAIRGRYFGTLLVYAMRFYERHRATITAALDSVTVAQLDAVAAIAAAVDLALDPEGPG